jgi:hypothetical protein
MVEFSGSRVESGIGFVGKPMAHYSGTDTNHHPGTDESFKAIAQSLKQPEASNKGIPPSIATLNHNNV